MPRRIYEVSFDRSGAFQHVKKVMDLKVMLAVTLLSVTLYHTTVSFIMLIRSIRVFG